MKKPFKINTGKTDDAEISKGKVPPIDDMEEGSDMEEASESPAKEKEEVVSGEGDIKGGVDKEGLKSAIKEVNMEKDLEYSVNNRSKEELQCLIKMAQAKLDSGSFKDGSGSNSVSPLR